MNGPMNNRLAKYIKTKFVKIAEDLVSNPGGLKIRLQKAKEKISKDSVKDALGNYVDDLLMFMRMCSAWATRKYTNISNESIALSVLAVVYFVTPTDFVPDFLLGLGFIDDIAVISWVLDKIKPDIEEFKKWENSNR
jgi:uncharacterized membrane protein YkvA (DUF1232 family)